ncbi:MAG: energy transducer TonB [Woeseiaceae bacterium]
MTRLTRLSLRVVVAIAAGLWGAQLLADVDVPQPTIGGDDPERVPLFTVIPDYPKVARRDRIEGEVQVCFDITRDGRTRRIAVRKSTHRVFEKPAVRAVRVSTYEALPDDTEMSGIKSCRTFRFTLEPVVLETSD